MPFAGAGAGGDGLGSRFQQEGKMATWKRLTKESSGTTVDVNMEHVVEIEREAGRTYSLLTFDFTRAALSVKETPDEIHASRIA
jgi:hypothetical protein